MDEYISITYTTSNEDGKQELVLEQEWPTWKFMWYAFLNQWSPRPETNIRKYVVAGTVWVEKETGVVPNQTIQFECFEAKGLVKRKEKIDAFFGDS